MRRFAIALLALGAIGSGTSRAAHVIDQQNQFDPTGGYTGGFSVPVFAPIGQSFRPTLASIAFATFDMGDFSSGGLGDGSYLVELRGGVDGLLLAKSNVTDLPANFSGTAEFDFASPIFLVTGTTYSLIIDRVDDHSAFGIFDQHDTKYTRGTEILSGAAVPDADTYFSEGIVTVSTASSPEPSSLVLGLVGVVGGVVCYAARRRLASGRPEPPQSPERPPASGA